MNKTQFILQHSEELQEAADNLKIIRKTLNSLEDNTIEAELDKVVARYDKYINDLIWGNPDRVDIDDMVNAAIENEWRTGTEPHFMMQAIDDVFNLLARKGFVKYQEEELDESVHGSTDEHAIVNAIIESWDDISKSLDRDMILTKQDYGKNSRGILDFTYKFYEESGTTKQINGTITVDFPEFNRGEYKKNVGPKTTDKVVEMALPSNVSDWLKRAATQSQEQAAKKASRWVEKLGKRIVGGTSIGRSPQTLILDITHHGSQLYINANGEIEFNDQEANDFKSFKKIFDTTFNIKENIEESAQLSEETLRNIYELTSKEISFEEFKQIAQKLIDSQPAFKEDLVNWKKNNESLENDDRIIQTQQLEKLQESQMMQHIVH